MNFLKGFFLIIIALALMSCGPPQTQPNKIDSAFKSLYDQFVSSAESAGVDVSGDRGLTVEFATLGQANDLGEVIGECYGVGYGNNVIDIDTKYWNNSDDALKLILLWHELGHCLLNEGHSSDTENIMYPVINAPYKFYNSNLADMIKKLFAQYGDNGSSLTSGDTEGKWNKRIKR